MSTFVCAAGEYKKIFRKLDLDGNVSQLPLACSPLACCTRTRILPHRTHPRIWHIQKMDMPPIDYHGHVSLDRLLGLDRVFPSKEGGGVIKLIQKALNDTHNRYLKGLKLWECCKK